MNIKVPVKSYLKKYYTHLFDSETLRLCSDDALTKHLFPYLVKHSDQEQKRAGDFMYLSLTPSIVAEKRMILNNKGIDALNHALYIGFQQYFYTIMHSRLQHGDYIIEAIEHAMQLMNICENDYSRDSLKKMYYRYNMYFQQERKVKRNASVFR